MKTLLRMGIVALASTSVGQTTQVQADPGMYVEAAGGLTKIIGQIAEFKRSGSALVSHATIGIKSQKENVQLLGPHAQNVVPSPPVFYFVPAKQEADAGVNAGDVILIRLEGKPERRQFEIAAHADSFGECAQSNRTEDQAVPVEGLYYFVVDPGQYGIQLPKVAWLDSIT